MIDREEKKKRIIEYFEKVPIQKYAAESVGIDEATLIRWKAEDASFANALLEARSLFVSKKIARSRPEFSLERTIPELREQKQISADLNVTFKWGEDADGDTSVHTTETPA